MDMREGTIASRTIYRLVLCSSVACLSSPGFAQQVETAAAANDAQGIEDIIVTAQRRETRLQDTPIAITALNAENLSERGVATVNDLAATVPNLTSTTGPQGSSDLLSRSICQPASKENLRLLRKSWKIWHT